MSPALSLHSIESFPKQLEIRGIASFLTRALDPFFFQRIFCGPIGLIKDAEHARKGKLRQFVSGELVGDVVPQLVLRSIVPFLFLDHFEAAAFFRIGWIEHVREKFHAFAQAFDDAEALVIERALDHFHHVFDLRGMSTRDESRPASDQFFHRIHRLIDRARGVGLAFETDRRRRRGLFLRQAIDEVVHDEIGHVDVLARAVIKMVAADGEPVAVTAEQEHV